MNRKIALLVVVSAVAASVCLATATNAGAAHTAQGLLALQAGRQDLSFRDPGDGLDVRFGKGVDRQADRRSRPHRQQERPAHERAARVSLRGGPDQ